MARIRSLHPAQWTDSAFVSCSPLARLLALGLRNEADDYGVFPWDPVQIKMRLLPADDVDVSVLLQELASASLIRPYEVDERKYGAIRNFRRYQTPRAPTSKYPLPDSIKDFLEGYSSRVQEVREEGAGKRSRNDPESFTEQFCSGVEIPAGVDTEEFRASWQDYVLYRREQKLRRLQSRSVRGQFAEFLDWGVDRSIAAIRQTIKKGWQGIFEPKPDPNGKPPRPRLPDKPLPNPADYLPAPVDAMEAQNGS